MKYELIVRPEPFSSPAEFDSYESFETEAFGQWQGWTRRDDPNDIRWVQDSLNRLMRLRLPLSGVMDAAARSALRSFQEKRGLTADGVLGPGTKRALAEAAAYPGEDEAFPVSRLPARTRAALTQGALAKKTSFRYVKDFSGPASECAEALKRAGKTRAEALGIINAQIGVVIAMLRKSATALKRGSRSDKTKTLFQKIFKVKSEFVPTRLKPTATIKDRGDVVATRCKRVAELLASGTIKFSCTINSTNCPDCSNNPRRFACSSYGDESKAPKNSRVVCLGDLFWDDMKAGKTDSLLATIMHEPFHIYYGVYVTEHRSDAGKFGGVNCIVQFVFETNGRAAPDRVHERCTNMVVRKEVGGFLSFRPEPWPSESEWEGEASRTGPDYIRWVQSSLNRALGLRLAVDGIMGPATRSAVRNFQQRKGLAVDGIVGPNTEAALIAAGAPRPPVAAVSATATGAGSPSSISPLCSLAGGTNCYLLYFGQDKDAPTTPDPNRPMSTDQHAHEDKLDEIADRVISSWQWGTQPVNSLLILGHASPEGSDEYNYKLAMRRAKNVSEALAQHMHDLEPGSGSRIGLQVESCGEKKPIKGASDDLQRRVEVCVIPGIPVIPACPTTRVRATSFADYVNLIRCAEMAFPNFTPRQMLSLLRQIYYGDEAWSLHGPPYWQYIIPCWVKMPDPRATLGTALFTSLQASEDVANTAMGHVFAGLEAMMCPTPNVTLHVAPLTDVVVRMPNEEFAGWGGDLGSAVAHRVYDVVDQQLSNTDWSHYFGGTRTWASDEDLNGDIDSYAIRQGLTGASCAAPRGTPIPGIPAPVSRILEEYYSEAATPLGAARKTRFVCFAQAIGGTFGVRKIKNKSSLAEQVRPRVNSFADMFYGYLNPVPASGMAERSGYLIRYSYEITRRFLDWVDDKL